MLTIEQAFPKGYTSYSQLSSYERCPWYFFKRYVCGVKGVDSHYGAFGRAIHKVFECDANSLIETGSGLPKSKMLEIYNDFWHTNDMCFGGDKKTEQNYYKRGLNMIDIYSLRKPLSIVSSEQEYLIDVPDLRVPIKAVIDLVYTEKNDTSDPCYIVRDYKTGKPYDSREVDESLQMSIYGMAIKQKYGVYPSKYEFDFLQNDTVAPTHRKRQQIFFAFFRIKKIIERILSEDFNEHYNNKYWCNNICDIGKARLCGK